MYPRTRWNGFEIIFDANLVEEGPPITVSRPWKERLFSLPWHPLRATKTTVPLIPMKGCYKIGDSRIIMHPAMKYLLP